jgi:hypothetical protein
MAHAPQGHSRARARTCSLHRACTPRWRELRLLSSPLMLSVLGTRRCCGLVPGLRGPEAPTLTCVYRPVRDSHACTHPQAPLHVLPVSVTATALFTHTRACRTRTLLTRECSPFLEHAIAADPHSAVCTPAATLRSAARARATFQLQSDRPMRTAAERAPRLPHTLTGQPAPACVRTRTSARICGTGAIA